MKGADVMLSPVVAVLARAAGSVPADGRKLFRGEDRGPREKAYLAAGSVMVLGKFSRLRGDRFVPVRIVSNPFWLVCQPPGYLGSLLRGGS